jgi:hypothetical protein
MIEYSKVQSFMEDRLLELYKKHVWEKIPKDGGEMIPPAWWETVIRHYYQLGYSEEQTVRVILETMKK